MRLLSFVLLALLAMNVSAQGSIFLDTVMINERESEIVDVSLTQNGFKHDTCTRRSESFNIYLPMKNNSIYSIITQKSMMVWYDSGFYIRGISNPLLIKPGGVGLVEMRVAPASRTLMRRAGVIPIQSEGFEHPGVRVALRLKYDQKVCRMPR